MRKLFGIPLFAVAAFLALTASVAAYTVASLTFSVNVEESIEVSQITCNFPNKVMPGETYSCTAAIKNQSGTAAYGMQYNGSVSAGPWIYAIAAQTAKEGGAIVLDKPKAKAGEQPIILPPPWGTIWFFVDADGPGPEKFQPYSPGQTINILANGIHWVEIKIKPSYSAPPGELKAEFKAERGEPSGVSKIEKPK